MPVVLVRAGRQLVAGRDDRRADAREVPGDRELAPLPGGAGAHARDRPRHARDDRRRAQVDEDVELVAQDDRVGDGQAVGLRHGDRGL